MRISFSQPVFIPWGGLFARLMASELMVILDNTNFAQGFTFVNRNRIKSPSGELWITVPIIKKGKGIQKINDLQIYEKKRWIKKFLSTLFHCYGKSIHFDPIYKKIESVVNNDDSSFLKMTIELMKVMMDELEINKKLIFQSELGINEKGTTLLVSIGKYLGADEVILPYYSYKHIDIDLFKKESFKIIFSLYKQIPYPQFWGNFIKNLSALDLLFCIYKDSKAIIEKSHCLIGE